MRENVIHVPATDGYCSLTNEDTDTSRFPKVCHVRNISPRQRDDHAGAHRNRSYKTGKNKTREDPGGIKVAELNTPLPQIKRVPPSF